MRCIALRQITIFDSRFRYTISACPRSCTACKRAVLMEPIAESLLLYKRHYYSFAFLAEFTIGLMSWPRTINANYNDTCVRYAMTKSKPPSKSSAEAVRLEFVRSHNVAHSDVFTCPDCPAGIPQCLIGDAVVVGIKSRFMADFDPPSAVSEGAFVRGMCVHYSVTAVPCLPVCIAMLICSCLIRQAIFTESLH